MPTAPTHPSLRRFADAVDRVDGASNNYPFQPIPEVPPKPFTYTASTNYGGLGLATLLVTLLVFQPFVVLGSVGFVGYVYGTEVMCAAALILVTTRDVLARVYGIRALSTDVQPGTYWHGKHASSSSPTQRGGDAVPPASFHDRVKRWVRTRPDYEQKYEAWWVWLYRAFDFGSLLTGYESTGDCMTLFAFVFYQRLRLTDAELYQRRMWVRVDAYTDGEEHAVPRDGGCAGAAEGEGLACDWAFPTEKAAGRGDDGTATWWTPQTPLLILLHGLNGGSRAMYVMDTADKARLDRGYVVCAINARGMGDTPIAGGALFHGARCDDTRETIAKVLAVWDAFCEGEMRVYADAEKNKTAPSPSAGENARGTGEEEDATPNAEDTTVTRTNPAYAVGFSMGAFAILQVLDRFGRGQAHAAAAATPASSAWHHGATAWARDFGASLDGKRRLKLAGAVAFSGLFDRKWEVDYTLKPASGNEEANTDAKDSLDDAADSDASKAAPPTKAASHSSTSSSSGSGFAGGFGAVAKRGTSPSLHSQHTWHPVIAAACVDSFSVWEKKLVERNAALVKGGAVHLTRAEKYAPIPRSARASDAGAEGGALGVNGYPCRGIYAPVCLESMRAARDVREIDIELTAPYHGFGSGMAGFRNYTESQRVRVANLQMCPVLHCCALDDPLIPPAAHIEGVERIVAGRHAPHKCVTYLTRSGGHLGWMEGNVVNGRNWAFMFDVAVSFLETCGEVAHEH